MPLRTRCGMTTIIEDPLGQKRRQICRRHLLEIFTYDGHYLVCPTCDRASTDDSIDR